MAPWSIVCVHLANGTSREWIPLESSSPETNFDWVCPDCIPDPQAETVNLKNLMPVCIHCVRHLREKFDPNFEEDPDVE